MSATSTARPRTPPRCMGMWRAPKTTSRSSSCSSLVSRLYPPTPPDALELLDPAYRLGAHIRLKSYYRIFFALIRCGPRRALLPLEVVIYIIRLAQFASPYPSKELSGLLIWRPSFYQIPDDSDARSSPRKLARLLKTAPLTEGPLQTITKVEVAVNLYFRYVSVTPAVWLFILICLPITRG